MSSPTSLTARLRARGLSVTLSGDDRPLRVLDDADVAVHAGEIVDLVGASGAGKSTVLKALARMMPDATGDLSLDGEPATAITPAVWRMRVALVAQRPSVLGDTVIEDVWRPWSLKARSHAKRPDEGQVRSLLDRLGLADVALARESGRLSVGQQARLALARVWLTSPDVLLLDEVDAALDDESAERVSSLTREFALAGGAVIRVRHRGVDGLASRRLRLASGTLAEEDL